LERVDDERDDVAMRPRLILPVEGLKAEEGLIEISKKSAVMNCM